jgi:hypothetical protein
MSTNIIARHRLSVVGRGKERITPRIEMEKTERLYGFSTVRLKPLQYTVGVIGRRGVAEASEEGAEAFRKGWRLADYSLIPVSAYAGCGLMRAVTRIGITVSTIAPAIT